MKSLIKQRREQGAVCPICHSPDYHVEPAYPGGWKPNIVCNQCKNTWQYGSNGGVYVRLMGDNDGA